MDNKLTYTMHVIDRHTNVTFDKLTNSNSILIGY